MLRFYLEGVYNQSDPENVQLIQEVACQYLKVFIKLFVLKEHKVQDILQDTILGLMGPGGIKELGSKLEPDPKEPDLEEVYPREVAQLDIQRHKNVQLQSKVMPQD